MRHDQTRGGGTTRRLFWCSNNHAAAKEGKERATDESPFTASPVNEKENTASSALVIEPKKGRKEEGTSEGRRVLHSTTGAKVPVSQVFFREHNRDSLTAWAPGASYVSVRPLGFGVLRCVEAQQAASFRPVPIFDLVPLYALTLLTSDNCSSRPHFFFTCIFEITCLPIALVIISDLAAQGLSQASFQSELRQLTTPFLGRKHSCKIPGRALNPSLPTLTLSFATASHISMQMSGYPES
jgi:hypothetical protein